MGARKRRKKKSGLGRVLEILANGLLLLVVLAFGISIAARFGREDSEVRPTSGEALYEEQLPPATVHVPERNRPTVDVRNGCGEGGLAETLMHKLRRAGFDVVEYKDADHFDYPHTLVKDRSGKPEAAGRVCAWLQKEFGVGETVSDLVAAPSSDILLILGADLADTLKIRERADAALR